MKVYLFSFEVPNLEKLKEFIGQRFVEFGKTFTNYSNITYGLIVFKN